MELKFYRLKVKRVVRETPLACSVVFEIPAELRETFKYKSGQYLTIKVNLPDGCERRAYSISSAPSVSPEDEIAITAKKVADGKVSIYLNDELKEGDELEVMPPFGNFVLDDENYESENYILFAAGSGITPIYSILLTLLAERPGTKVVLVYLNRDETNIIFKKELDKLQLERDTRFKAHYFLTNPPENWTGYKGRITANIAKNLLETHVSLPVDSSQYFMCGPNGFMKEVELALAALEVPQKKIHRESFTAPIPTEFPVAGKDAGETPEVVRRRIRIKIYGETGEFDVEPDDTVLTAAQSAGFDPPFSCQIGACSTCRAKVESGKIMMDESEGLTESEIEEGYCLTCQTHPLTDDVIINYDA
ncbi:MAG: 2Fe-2S iron-sulfur cluster-binding protein [Chloroflexota bacterium]